MGVQFPPGAPLFALRSYERHSQKIECKPKEDMAYEDHDVVVKESSIEGFGLFAKRDFKRGETVLKWNPVKTVNSADFIFKNERRYIHYLENGTKVLMGIPERFVNHSCDANTRAIHNTDVAIRDIYTGEEITTNYSTKGTPFQCTGCGGVHCEYLGSGLYMRI